MLYVLLENGSRVAVSSIVPLEPPPCYATRPPAHELRPLLTSEGAAAGRLCVRCGLQTPEGRDEAAFPLYF